MRSKLFVPGVRPELFSKALGGEADAISIDLEDAVVQDRKAQARDDVAAFLRSPAARRSDKLIIVRCNSVDTEHFREDIEAIAQPALDMINLPKLESAAALRTAVKTLAAAEGHNGVTRPIGVLATIESPRGMRRAAKIAAADPRVLGLQLGLVDLFESQGIERSDLSNVHAAMFALRLAAGEAGVFAIDSAFPDLQDRQGFRREAELARGLGFCGKSCIHPSQVSTVNDVFVYSAAQISAATRVVAASERAAADGSGVVIVDGKMIDLPLLKRAKHIIAAGASSREKQR